MARVSSPVQEVQEEILRSPVKPELNSPIKDDLIGSGGPRSRSAAAAAPPRRPCGFTKAPPINVAPPEINASEATPKFLSRATSKAEERGGDFERGRQLDSYQQKLLRDLQRSVGSPFGARNSMRTSHSRLTYPCQDRSESRIQDYTSKHYLT